MLLKREMLQVWTSIFCSFGCRVYDVAASSRLGAYQLSGLFIRIRVVSRCAPPQERHQMRLDVSRVGRTWRVLALTSWCCDALMIWNEVPTRLQSQSLCLTLDQCAEVSWPLLHTVKRLRTARGGQPHDDRRRRRKQLISLLYLNIVVQMALNVGNVIRNANHK